MDDNSELRPLPNVLSNLNVDHAGQVTLNAGKFARGATIIAFEMLGGVEAFAEWARDNPNEFYTKMFGKVIGREVEHHQSKDIEDLLDAIDGEAEDITDTEYVEEVSAEEVEDYVVESGEEVVLSHTKQRLVAIADQYCDSELYD